MAYKSFIRGNHYISTYLRTEAVTLIFFMYSQIFNIVQNNIYKVCIIKYDYTFTDKILRTYLIFAPGPQIPGDGPEHMHELQRHNKESICP